jgi:hypothetical protein
MNKLIAILCLAVTLNSHADVADKQNQVYRLANQIMSANGQQDDESVLDAAIGDLQSALNKLNGDSGSAGYECLKYLQGKGYNLGTSKSACERITTQGALNCLQDLMARGYNLATSVSSCEGVSTVVQFDCVKHLLNMGYNLSASSSSCQKITSSSRLTCLKEQMALGYNLSTSVSTCSSL